MKKLLLSFCLFCFISLKLFAQYNWTVYPNTPTTPNRFDDVYFINPNQGWAVDPLVPTFYTNSSLAKVYETRNGGVTWELVHDSMNDYLRCVGFIDSMHGFIGDICLAFGGNDTNPMYYTNDGGKTLTPVNFPSPRPKGICGISIATDSVVYAYGRYNGPAVLAKTTDAGKTWKTSDMSPYASVGLIDGWFWSKDTGFVTGQNGANSVILHTVDGGATWQTVYAATRGDTDHVWKIFFPSRNIGYGSIEYTGYFSQRGSYKTYFVKTTDGGKTWTEHPFIDNYDEEGCGFINDTVGWIGGWTGMSYITKDGGNSWGLDSSFAVPTIPKTQPLPYINRFRKFGDSLFYASGNTIYKLMLYKQDTATKQTSQAEMVNNSIVTNFPNPYNTETTIIYTIPRTSKHVLFEVYDAAGRKLLTQDLGAQVAGTHQMNYSQPLAPGEYTYTITTDNFKGTRKMMVAK